MCVALFQEIQDLKRVRVMNIELGTLAEGEHRELKGEELRTFLHALELA
jgi:16S rRNA U516 pseudouridylate synthase RsuA-like enzyme